MDNALNEALSLVLTYARPHPDSAAEDREAEIWREFDAGSLTKDELVRQLGLQPRIDDELDRIRRRDEGIEDSDEQKLEDLRADLVRIFGEGELGKFEARISPEGYPCIRSGDGQRVYFRWGGPTATFACHRKISDTEIEATLYNRAGFRADRKRIPMPDGGGWFRTA